MASTDLARLERREAPRQVSVCRNARRRGELLRAELKRRDDGKPIDLPAAPTLNVFAEQWLMNERDTLRPSTLKFYRHNLDNHVLPAVGKIRLTAIRRTHVNSLCAD